MLFAGKEPNASTAHFCRNVFSTIPRYTGKLLIKMLKAIHAQEDKKTARKKGPGHSLITELQWMKQKRLPRRQRTALRIPLVLLRLSRCAPDKNLSQQCDKTTQLEDSSPYPHSMNFPEWKTLSPC